MSNTSTQTMNSSIRSSAGGGSQRERRNSTTSTSSSSPFLPNSFKSPQLQQSDIQMQDMRSISSHDSAELEWVPPKQDIFDKLYNFITNTDNFLGKSRKVYINNQEGNKLYKYSSNYVKTAKYTIITFLPLNLFEQFRRLANIYFLMISALQLIPGVSPTGRFTTLGPLLVVLAITALKEAYEDIKRHKQDDKVNFSKTMVLRAGQFVSANWQDVMVGDIVHVQNKQYIPADIVALSTSEPSSICYIETANLDGETNLKMKQSLEETSGLGNSVESLSSFNGHVECEHPNNRLYNFVGSLYIDGHGIPLSIRQVLLRGAMLRNTKWVNGLVVYTGRDTRLMRNSSPTPLKRSGVEKLTNQFIIIIFFLQLLLCTSCAVANGFWDSKNSENWYLAWTRSPGEEGALSFLTFLILFNNLIPISLYVSLEFVKLFQAYFINNDLGMYYKENDTPALARTSNLNEELGQVEYIFSDKTGTLTQNKMEFKRCTIGGVVYGQGGMTEATMGRMLREGKMSTNEINTHMSSTQQQQQQPPTLSPSSSFYDEKLMRGLAGGITGGDKQSILIRDFFHVLSVCHTVIPEVEDGRIVYQAASPDEGALVHAAKAVGFEFTTRSSKSLTVMHRGSEQRFEVLNILEFNSTRKRMSVVVRHPDGRLVLYCKGADTVIFERLAKGQPYADTTITHLQDFATEGLRTLCIAMTEIDPIFYETWSKEFYAASNAIEGREEELARVAELIEKNLHLLGATAIEDKLQEGVPDTISMLRRAGIKIWVLTGDKQETAINIGFSCQLLTQDMEMMVINEESKENTIIELNRRLDDIGNPNSDVDRENMALIIDGATLLFALEDSAKILLLQLAQKCKVVICCRVSPLQKAQMVELVRENLDAVTLAIGDGANDVSMIQAAHVGIGISGEEGLQAARSSDYAIAQFRFLQRLLLVHGRYSYRRVSKLICYCFYKNITLYITQFWFAIFNGWSGQTFYERFTLTAYNVAWSFLPIIVLGIIDKDVGEKYVIEHPQLYRSGQKGIYFNIRVFWGWVAYGIFHSLLLYGFPTAIFWHDLAYPSGRAIDLFTVGTVAYSCIIITVNLKLALETRYWTWISHLSIWGSIVLYFIWLLVFGKFWEFESLDVGSDLYDIIYRVGKSALFYFSLIFIPIACLWIEFTLKFIFRDNRPQPYHIVQEIARKSKRNKSRPNNNNDHPERKLSTGYSFSQEPGQADAIKKSFPPSPLNQPNSSLPTINSPPLTTI